MFADHLPTWELVLSTWDLKQLWSPEVTLKFSTELEKVIREKKFEENVTDCDIDLSNLLLDHNELKGILYFKIHIKGRGDWRPVVDFLKTTWNALQVQQDPKITLRKMSLTICTSGYSRQITLMK